ncbi:MAG: hypothetical protein LBU11_02695 [Zoogloeaceae bacterium]|nr:hypothetical protein [Zoogloeaceae bacterium]
MKICLGINMPEAMAQMALSPIPVPLQIAMGYAGSLITVASGIAMLKGRNWARFLYVIWRAVDIVIALLTSPMNMMLVFGVVFYLIITFFLFRPAANAYFSQKG